jgi:hypothetical protein
MSIRSRLDRLEQSTAAEDRQIGVFVFGSLGDDITPSGTIEPWGDGRGAVMVVPAEHGADPIKGLSAEQRAYLRPGDHIKAHTWVIEGDSLFTGERNYVWRGPRRA